jgi:proteasome lid subunit RPN8/RPN11
MQKDDIVSEAYVSMSQEAWHALYQDVCQREHIEACGALMGRIDSDGNWHVDQVRPLTNTANSAVYFEFDPLELLEIDLSSPDAMIGVYHSHPGGYPVASSTDRQNMLRVNVEQHIPWIWLIVVGPFNGPHIAPRAYHHYQDKGLQLVPLRFLA